MIFLAILQMNRVVAITSHGPDRTRQAVPKEMGKIEICPVFMEKKIPHSIGSRIKIDCIKINLLFFVAKEIEDSTANNANPVIAKEHSMISMIILSFW